MCGRFNLIATKPQIMEHFSLQRLPDYQPDYNIPPGQKIIAVVRLEDGSNKAVNLHWGLIPSWSKDRKISSHLINARVETLTEKPSFRKAYQQRRCLIPATGFFEWQTTKAGKQPFHIHQPEYALFAFAGLWEHWEHQQETVYSCTIITTPANAKIAPVHDRMPVIITPDFYNRWLDKKTTTIKMADFLTADAYRTIQITPISARVNNPLHNDIECLAEVCR
ncbi:SOS response-associated peptidase [Methylobacter sp. S3L5C]|uniref:SOS response-associated peptidase n=1 Tax=Methylobacter sp. S3L5C TaxID=2839024 RepID=UPI001FAE4E16|nr:SOS response-associated peptidase [Methylobacter sp. S3L5C]UOA10554.1 SOS response-associated peptidase [Methylobacter sp. S3L5C]